MTHVEKRASPAREFQIAVVAGGMYGAAHTVSGHPLDNVKARMQLDASFRGLGPVAATRALWAREGARGFYRGFVPPLAGSVVYRSVMFSSYEFAFTWAERDLGGWWREPLPGTGGAVRPLVVGCTVFAAGCRGAVEQPFEYAKCLSQVGRGADLRAADMFRGLGAQLARTTGLLLLIFVPYDHIRRSTGLLAPAPSADGAPPSAGAWAAALCRQGLVTTTVCGLAYAGIWPIETLKNLAQAGLPRAGASLAERVAHLGGARGLYRGAAPGIVSGGVRNGCAMMGAALCQRLATAYGFRDE